VILYLAGLAGWRRGVEYYISKPELNNNPGVGVLSSYAYKQQFERARDMGVNQIMIDSGAFSVEKSGHKIDIDAYIKFVADNLDDIEVITSLDVLADEDESIANWEYMRERLPQQVVPVWHAGESWSVLDYYATRTDYIGIGGIAVGTTAWATIEPLFDSIFGRYPTHKFHAYGINDARMRAYPLHSCDALTWRNGSRFGQVILPETRFHIGTTLKATAADELEALGVGEWLRERGVPYPIPEDMDRREYFYLVDFCNVHTLVQMFVDDHKPARDVATMSLF